MWCDHCNSGLGDMGCRICGDCMVIEENWLVWIKMSLGLVWQNDSQGKYRLNKLVIQAIDNIFMGNELF